jgi:hypothetical protein
MKDKHDHKISTLFTYFLVLSFPHPLVAKWNLKKVPTARMAGI